MLTRELLVLQELSAKAMHMTIINMAHTRLLLYWTTVSLPTGFTIPNTYREKRKKLFTIFQTNHKASKSLISLNEAQTETRTCIGTAVPVFGLSNRVWNELFNSCRHSSLSTVPRLLGK
jgi:hypothetical protein